MAGVEDSMMPQTLLTILQALQLVALAPCVFVILFLLVVSRQGSQIVIPVLYFLALACTFLLPLLDLHAASWEDLRLRGALMLGESLVAAVSFLLIMQFLLGRIPPLPYWSVLLIPLIGSSLLIYATLVNESSCVFDRWCVSSSDVTSLYHVFAALLIFLLQFMIFVRTSPSIDKDDHVRQHKYWLIVALVCMNIALIATDLARLARVLTPDEALFVMTLLRVSFIYLVLTSIFRVFDRSFAFAMERVHVPVRSYTPTEADHAAAQQVTALLENEKIYREMGFNREELAKRVGLTEHQLSRVINTVLKKSFNELINGYRIEEAKQRLKNEPDTSITVIAFEVGFNSIASFNRVFKELVGRSPTEYKSQS